MNAEYNIWWNKRRQHLQEQLQEFNRDELLLVLETICEQENSELALASFAGAVAGITHRHGSSVLEISQ